MENKVRKAFFSMIEKYRPKYSVLEVKMALISSLSDQIELGRVSEDRRNAMLEYINILLEEYYAETINVS